MIYKLCLPVGKALVLKVPPGQKEGVRAGRRVLKVSFPALLQINSQIRAEAAPIFYGTNSWTIIDIPRGLSLPEVFFTHVHEATVTFDRRVMSIKKVWSISDQVFDKTTKTGSSHNRLHIIHNKLKKHLLAIWQDKCSTLRTMSSLTELTVDVENCKCPIGCCRMVVDIFAELDGRVTLKDERRIEIDGLVFEQEAELIHTGNFRCEACDDIDEEEYVSEGETPDPPPCWRSKLPYELL